MKHAARRRHGEAPAGQVPHQGAVALEGAIGGGGGGYSPALGGRDVQRARRQRVVVAARLCVVSKQTTQFFASLLFYVHKNHKAY